MSGDNTCAMKKHRAYERLLCAIKEGSPPIIVDSFLCDAIDCAETLNEHQKFKETLLAAAKIDAENYVLHYQAGRTILVRKDSPLGKILEKGKYVPG